MLSFHQVSDLVLCDACYLPLPSSTFDFIVLIVTFCSGLQNDALLYDTFFILLVFGLVFYLAVILKCLEFLFFPPCDIKFRTYSELHTEELGCCENCVFTIFCMTALSCMLRQQFTLITRRVF
jgi:hypothetical protein